MLHLNLLWIKNNRVFWAAKTLEEDLRMETTWSVFALLIYLYTDLAVSKILPISINMIKLMVVETHLYGK